MSEAAATAPALDKKVAHRPSRRVPQARFVHPPVLAADTKDVKNGQHLRVPQVVTMDSGR